MKLQFAVGIPNIVVFTSDEGQWIVFLLHRKMLKEFMDEAERFIKSYAGDDGRNEVNGEWKTYDYLPFEIGVILEGVGYFIFKRYIQEGHK
ncbi:hypothetical protein [Paenibacillus sp. Soil724D2]|uniref:hypothetical protein n=1 Tax=Paenibacillus sp. (strain Soil724D2) TaxID=1736392 RepID=UPI0007155F2D|nr:hypothetical protein [Paenibacillus sp. Soil724D2]KRE34007.1 hypothetical protein ASG85_11515 [Paenibacillus sp. Soil724D2]